MIDKKKRDIVLLHSNKTARDIVFKDIFKKAEKFGWKTIYVNTDSDGYIDPKMIKEKVPDWNERIYRIGLRVKYVNARRAQSRNDQVAAFHVRMRGYGQRQELQAFHPK